MASTSAFSIVHTKQLRCNETRQAYQLRKSSPNNSLGACSISASSSPEKGSPHHRPKFNYPSPADAGEIHPGRSTHGVSQPSLPESSTTLRYKRQRRISRNHQHGMRVSRHLPASASRGTLSAAENQAPLLQASRSTDHPYWGALQLSSASCRNSRENRPIDDHTADVPCTEDANPALAKDKALPNTEDLHYSPESTDLKRLGRKTPKQKKRFGLADPVAWDVINRSLMQQQRLSDLIVADGPVAVPIRQSSKKNVDSVSRTSSQRKALNRFAKELEKYADAAGAAGKAPVITPTISESKASIHTVKPLVPYKDEFCAAGLAVTSAEQSQSLTNKAHAQSLIRRSRPYRHSNRQSQARKELDGHSDGTSSRTTTSTSRTSSGSYVEFSPPNGHMSHVVAPLVPRKANTKPKHCHAKKRLLSWFLKKPSIKDGSVRGYPLPVRIRQVKGGQIKSNDLSFARHDHRWSQHTSHKPAMQNTPRKSTLKLALPTKYVTPKKEPSVALTAGHCGQSDQSLRPMQDSGHHRSVFDARPSLGGVGLEGKRDITGGLLLKARPEPIATIEEVTETTVFPVEHNNQDHCLSPTKWKDMTTAIVGTFQQPVAVSSATHESSVPSLPFAARFAASTTSSLQRALDDACRKLDEENRQADNQSEQAKIRQKASPIPQRDLHHRVSHDVLPPKPHSADKFLNLKKNMSKVETLLSTSKPLPPEPVSAAQATPEQCSNTKPPPPSRKTLAVPDVPVASRALTGKCKNAVAELAKAEKMLKDLDVFLNDYDDADIKDRDVIKGLQVATHAAADDLYDAYIQHKTGLRIRRFLADLKSFEDIGEIGSSDQQARERRAESRRLQRIQDRNSRR
ncbi:hypothetical protein HD806DRAFT_519473 [Xylariaceae sp. AK1471]|nr:hypothetical protein HD806DRAFT_519473 [Xylariaceae sp. AK1471]